MWRNINFAIAGKSAYLIAEAIEIYGFPQASIKVKCEL